MGLTRRIAGITRGYDSLDETLVRHLFDLQIIASHIKLDEKFIVLAKEIIEQDRLKFKRHHEYINNPFNEIKYSLETLGKDTTWEDYYKNFVLAMVHGENNIEFKQCYDNLQNLTKRILSNI